MRKRDFEESIKYLKEKFAPSWSSLVELSCKKDLSNQVIPKRSKFLTYAGTHSYGPLEVLICEGEFKELVFSSMLKSSKCSAPTLSEEPIHTGKIELLLPFQDKILRLVDESSFTIYNITLPEHVLFPGFVKLSVSEKNSKTFVFVLGEGIGNWANLNAFFGPLIFKRILNRNLVPFVRSQTGLAFSSNKT
jgi:hypothetical protein